MERQPNTEYILSLSYGKDSLACLEAIRQLGYPLDRIIHAEVWATDTIPADLPPMVKFKFKADKIIKERYGLDVEHIYATRGGGILSYEKQFYSIINKGRGQGKPYGFPHTIGAWCNSRLKSDVLQSIGKANIRKDILSYTQTQGGEILTNRHHRLPCAEQTILQWETQNRKFTDFQYQSAEEIGAPNSNRGFSESPIAQGAKKNIVQYLGIAADEPIRIARHTSPDKVLPLVDIGWNEAYCRQWCEENDLLSPIYTTATRGGCWFCHNQGVDQLRLLRKNYPEYWALLLKWDSDSPTTFKSDGHTVHDFEKRFQAEDDGLIKVGDRKFRWKQVLAESNTEE